MIAVSLLEFFRTGTFGPLRLGLSYTDVLDLLGPPDNPEDMKHRNRHTSIWRYGDLEVFFSYEKARGTWLDLLQLDYWGIASPDGGSRIALDPWIIRGNLPIPQVQAAFDEQGISYQRVSALHVKQFLRLVTASNVTLGFEQDKHAADFGLVHISLFGY